MNGYHRGRQVSLGSLPLILGVAALVLCPNRCAHAFANIKIGSSNTENISFAVYNTSPGTNGQPSFSNGLMTSAGSQLFPVLTSVNGTAQSLSQTDTTAYTHTLAANQNPPFTTALPSTFGAATYSTSASTALPKNGTGLAQQAGVSFNSGTFLQSAATMTGGLASVSFGHLHASFTNSAGPGSGSYVGVPGAEISATGVLSPTAGSFVELANREQSRSRITWAT